MSIQTIRYSGNQVVPLFPNEGRTLALQFMPNLTIVAGQLLGQVSDASANEVQTLNFGTITGGTFTLSVTGIDGGTFTTAALDYDISNANLKIAIEALFVSAGYTGVTVTLTGGPAPVDVVVTFGGTAANWDFPLMTASSSLIGDPAAAVAATGTLTAAGQPSDGGTVTIGTKTYTFKTALTEVGDDVAASGTVTVTTGQNVTDGTTLTIGNKTYRFKATPAAINDIDIGSDAAGTAANLVTAINTGASGGDVYAGTVAHTQVTAAAGEGAAANIVTITAVTAGAAGNAIPLTHSVDQYLVTVGGGTAGAYLTGGVDGAEVANEVLIGGSASASLDNLIAAINGAAGEGSTYGTGTTASTQVTAAAGDGDTVVVTASTAGVAGNSIATTETDGNLAFAAATLANGAAAGTATLTVDATTAGVRNLLWGAYSDAATDGRQTARAIAQYDFRTDNAGRVVFATSGSAPEYGQYHQTAPAWIGPAHFKTADLTGLDAAAVVDLGALISGTTTDGILAVR